MPTTHLDAPSTAGSLDVLLRVPFAHRGRYDNVGGVPENSMAAFTAARDAGFGIELDVAITADGSVIAFHDDDFQRLCGTKAQVKDTPWNALASLRLLGTDQKIPLLAEVLSLLAGRVPLLVELKSFDARAGFHDDGRLEEAVLRLCKAYAGPLAFKSFNPGSILRLKSLGATAPVGFLACDYTRDGDFPFLSLESARDHAALLSREARAADFVSYSIDDLTDVHRATVKATPSDTGLERSLLVWTVRTEEQFAKAQKLADNIVFEWSGVTCQRFRSPSR